MSAVPAKLPAKLSIEMLSTKSHVSWPETASQENIRFEAAATMPPNRSEACRPKRITAQTPARAPTTPTITRRPS